MTTITPDTSTGEASYLLGWALFEILDREHSGRVRFPQNDDDWLTAPGHTIFVPVGDGTPVSQIANSMLPVIHREIDRQFDAAPQTDDWFIELDYWAHALSGDSERIGDGLRFDVIVQVRR